MIPIRWLLNRKIVYVCAATAFLVLFDGGVRADAVENGNFETGDLSGWSTSSQTQTTTFAVVSGDAAAGAYSLYVTSTGADQASLTQTVTGLANGIYSLSASVRSGGGQMVSYLGVSGFGAEELRASLPAVNQWRRLYIRGIEVTNGRMDIAFRTHVAAGQWSRLDDFQLVKDDTPYTLLKGGDITVLSMVEDAGGRFYENGVEKDCLEILKNRGWNFVRIRVYNDPGNPAYTPSNRLPAGYQNPQDALALAQRAKAKGFQIQLTFHYSDYWTNPGQQIKPHEWEGLTFNQLRDALADFTQGFVQQMVAQGTPPEFVSLGNETPGGILYPDGSTSNWSNLAQLFNAGYNAVKAAWPDARVILHLDGAGEYDKYNWFLGECNARNVQYDIIGASYYPYWTQKTIVEAQAFFDYITAQFNRPVMIMETGYNWNPTRSDGWPGQLENNGPMTYPSTPEGQRDFLLELLAAIPAVQNGRCIGVLYWDPIMITVPGIGWELGGVNVVDNTTLFDFQGNALVSLDAYTHNGVYLTPAPDPDPPAAPVPTALYEFEGSVNDSSGNSHHGVNSGATYVGGKVGAAAAQFNGTSAYVTIPPSVQTDLTVSMWVKTTDLGSTSSQWRYGKGLVDGYVAGTAADWGTSVLNGRFAFGVGNSDTTLTSSSAVNNGQWRHVAATRHSATGAMAVYVDGLLGGGRAGPVGPRTASANLRIGSIATGTTSGYLNGTIDDVRLYSRVLSAREIAALLGPPAAPANVAAVPGDARVSLEWPAVSRAFRYTVKRSTSAAGPYTILVSGLTETAYSDMNLTNGTTYYYGVAAGNAAGLSADSDPVSATPQRSTDVPSPERMQWQQKPAASGPTSVMMTAVTAAHPSGVEYFFTCTSGGGHHSGWQTGPVYEDTGLLPNARYTYTVTARSQSAEPAYTAASIPASVLLESIRLNNPSFEADNATGNLTPQGWTWNGLGGRGVTAGGTQGSYYYWQGNSSILYQTTDVVIPDEGVRYGLRADCRNSWQGSPKAVIYYDDGGSRIELASVSLPAGGDTWAAWDGLNVTAVSTAGSVGKAIGVELTLDNYPGDVWSEFDNVQLYVSTPVAWLYGDFTGDHTVDVDDLAEIALLWLSDNCQLFADFDIHNDCQIDLSEFSMIAENWLITQ